MNHRYNVYVNYRKTRIESNVSDDFDKSLMREVTVKLFSVISYEVIPYIFPVT